MSQTGRVSPYAKSIVGRAASSAGQHATRIDLAPFFSPARDRGEALESALEIIAIGVRGAS
jgi:hypothetical protein